MENINILNLPDDVLEHIFIKVDSRDLLNLTTVCSRFNTIIGSNGQLMSRWMVRWWKRNLERLDIQSLLASERKYQHLDVWGVKGIGPELGMFLTKHATSLHTITFYECSFKSSELGSALRGLAENLWNLTLGRAMIDVDNTIRPIQFKNLTRLNLDWIVSSSAFGFFTGASTITDLKLTLPVTDIVGISKFLQSLDGLTTLKIVPLSPTLFSEDFNSMCRFRLKTLELDFDHRRPRMNEHFWKFIDMQRSTLLTLILGHIGIDRLDILLSLTNLQKLDLFECKLIQNSNPLVENTSIKELRIRQVETETDDDIFSDLIRKCSRLKRIHASSMKLSFETVFAIRNSKIEALDLNFCTFYPMPIPSLKKLYIWNSNRDSTDAVRLLRFNPQLKELSLPDGMRRNPKYAEAIEQMNLDSPVIGY